VHHFRDEWNCGRISLETSEQQAPLSTPLGVFAHPKGWGQGAQQHPPLEARVAPVN
jgi:hypothetical protein